MTDIVMTTWCQPDCTLGRLSCGSFHCFTLELPWLDNEPGRSCIPAGRYPVFRYDSPTKGPVLLLKQVPDRMMIEIHAGNFTREIRGCILPGDGITYLDRDSIPDVVNSRKALEMLLELVPTSAFLTITRS